LNNPGYSEAEPGVNEANNNKAHLDIKIEKQKLYAPQSLTMFKNISLKNEY
jgi:hypothetical protein